MALMIFFPSNSFSDIVVSRFGPKQMHSLSPQIANFLDFIYFTMAELSSVRFMYTGSHKNSGTNLMKLCGATQHGQTQNPLNLGFC